jgi:hypothetical protein
MTDLFGKKVKKRAEELDKANEVLIAQIREMDQLIFSMSQKPNFEAMRSDFNALQALATARMQLESDRIRDLLIPEIKKVYIK